MKRVLLGALLVITTCTASAFSNHTVPDWDRPLKEKRFSPSVYALDVVRLSATGPLRITFFLSEDTDSRNWEAVIGVRTYTRIGFNTWQWVTALYHVPCDPNNHVGGGDFNVPSYNQYDYIPGSDPWPGTGYYYLKEDQYWVATEPYPL